MNQPDLENKNNKVLDEIDLRELFGVLWSGKVKITVVTLLFALSSLFISLSMPNIYTSQSLLMVVNNSDKGGLSSLGGDYGGLAAMAGINLPSTYNEDRGTLAMETIKSRDFLDRLLSFEGVLPKLIATESYDIQTEEILFNDDLYDDDKKTWVSNRKGSKSNKPSYLAVHPIYLKIISTSKDRDSGYITISVKHQSPQFSHTFLSLIISEVNKLLREADLEESERALNYLNEQLLQTQNLDIKKSINQLIESQMESQMLARINKEYVLRPLDRPFIPEVKSEPNRVLISILGTILGSIFAILWVLIVYYVPSIKGTKSNS